ncbi:hypothetical protein [Okeania sp. KiyG1]|uniref:hypothetical protein n=1 Tax=Okeania sp. KiyG1 TaxID=2720165 RepID=UPI0019203F40|nr:hypothetical protein [Okeania sp. KiyG1]GFZ95074.1 hypothetical protein CYANOKiyG1_06100 [Okeania sp. KiyG1]
MNIQEIVIEQICKEFKIDPNNDNQQLSVENLKDIIRCTTNKMLMAHFQILLDNYLENSDKNYALHQLSVFANIESENNANEIKKLSGFHDIGKQIANIEVRFLETTLGLRT